MTCASWMQQDRVHVGTVADRQGQRGSQAGTSLGPAPSQFSALYEELLVDAEQQQEVKWQVERQVK